MKSAVDLSISSIERRDSLTTENQITSQWDDFLLRATDPYALTKYEILLSWMGTMKEKKVLVVGSGSGELAVMFAQRGAYVTAFDISAEYISLTEQNARRAGVKITCLVATIESFQSDTPFDVVVATDVIEHIQDDLNAVRKCHQFLKNQGTLILTVPALQFLFGSHDVVLEHFRRYSKASLERVINPCFHIQHIRYFGFFLIPVALLFSRILKKSYPVQDMGLPQGSGPGGLRILSRILKAILQFERQIPFPLGTSLLVMATKRSAE